MVAQVGSLKMKTASRSRPSSRNRDIPRRDGFGSLLRAHRRLLTRPQGRFDLIVCVEVFEHILDPVALLADLNSSLQQDGAILLSTLCCSQTVVDKGIANWWYCVPRNGHISFYSPESLALLAQPHGLQYRRLNDYLHVMYRHPAPAWLSVLGVA
jgi:SAM-dependent methyltransferase